MNKIAFGAAVSLFSICARAAEYTWTGATDGNWVTPANWTDQKAPTSQDTAIFAAGKNPKIELSEDAKIKSIKFDGSAADGFTIDNKSLTIVDGGSIVKDASPTPHNQTIGSDVRIAGAVTFANNDQWAHYANQLIFGGKILGDGNITITGAPTNGGGVSFLADSSKSFTGKIKLASGMMLLAKEGRIGSKGHPIVMQGGEFFCDTTTDNDFEIAGSVIWKSSGPNSHSGNITVKDGAQLILTNGGGNPLDLTGVISGHGTIKMEFTNTTLGGDKSNTFNGKILDVSNGGNPMYNDLRLAKTNGAIAIMGDLELQNKANIVWQGDDEISEHSAITLGGGTLSPSGHKNKLGIVTLTGAANIDLSGANSTLHFADSHAAAWKAKSQLIIHHWNATDHTAISFGTTDAGLSKDQIADIGFDNPAGKAPGVYHATISKSGEILPTDKAVVAIDPPFDISPTARTAHEAIYTCQGLEDLSGAHTPLKAGMKISFFGDSITWLNTYITTINDALGKGQGTKDLGIHLFNHGVNGGGVLVIRDGSPNAAFDGKSNNGPQAAFAKVLDDDHSDIAVVYIGINDVWWRDTPPADFEKALRDIVATAKAHGTTLVLATLSVQNEKPDGTNPHDKEIEQFAQITRDVASSTGTTLVDLRKAYVAYLQNNNYELRLDGTLEFKPSGILTYDGVHPNAAGYHLLAEQISEGIFKAAGGK